MKFQRHFTKPNLPIADQIEWKTVSSEILTSDGIRIFYMPSVEVPSHWTQGPTNILAQKYFRKAGVPNHTVECKAFIGRMQNPLPAWLCPSTSDTENTELLFESEYSARQVFHRLAGAWTYWGWKEGIFKDNSIETFPGTSVLIPGNNRQEENAQIFYDEIYYMLAHQFAAPNSPQWFNTGLNWAYGITGDKSGQWAVDSQGFPYETQDSYTNPQVHACYIQPISDNLVESGGIFDLLRKEAIIFKHGSGTGTNFSNLRSKYETLSGGGKSSGLMSFLKIYDTAAGAIQSGGTTRRAAKLICLDLDHPEIEEFVEHKMKEEAKAAALYVGSKILNEINDLYSEDLPQAMIDRAANGIMMDVCDLGFEGEAMSTVSGQNANVSIRITDKFLQSTNENFNNWPLYTRKDRRIITTLKSKDLWQKICTAAWACADPGLQFHDTINLWHTCKADGDINASNPCSEYMFLDDTACNLASLNLGKFLLPDHTFDTKSFTHATRIWTTVLEISVFMASFPSKEIAHNSYAYRTLGLGYCNAGGILMRQGIGYDSDKSRNLVSGITALMHFQSYHTSQEMAKELGPFERWENNKNSMSEVIQMHMGKLSCVIADNTKEKTMINNIIDKIMDIGKEIDPNGPFRNAQTTLIAPTGTIALLMDSGDFTGIEPGFSLVQYKQLAGGGGMKIVNNCVPEGLRSLGYTQAQIMSISQHITTHDTIEGWTRNGEPMPEEHLSVFDCAVPGGETGTRSLRPMAHVLMVAVTQPFLSGAISKTVNLPNDATIADVDHIYRESHRLRLKAVALYRDGSKLTQPLNSKQKKQEVNLTKDINKILNAHTKIAFEDNRDVFNQTEAILNKSFEELSNPRTEKIMAMSNVLTEELLDQNIAPSFESLLNSTPDPTILPRGKRERLPPRTTGYRQKYSVDGQSSYQHTGEYADGRLGEVFIEFSREGSLVRALANSLGKAVSIGLQYGVPLEEFVDAFVFTKFEPSGIVHGHDRIKLCSSPLDLIFKDLAIHYLGMEEFANIEPPSPERSEERVPEPKSKPNLEEFILDEFRKRSDEEFINNPGVGLPLGIMNQLTPAPASDSNMKSPNKIISGLEQAVAYAKSENQDVIITDYLIATRATLPPTPDSTIIQDSIIFSGLRTSIEEINYSKPLTTIRLKHGDACQQCGHYPTIRTGTCITCPNCGANSGCG